MDAQGILEQIRSRIRAVAEEHDDAVTTIESLKISIQDLRAVAVEKEAILEELKRLYSSVSQNGSSQVAEDRKRPRTSQAIRDLLVKHSGGLTIGEIADELEGVVESSASNWKNTISTTLYNMKTREEITHDKDTGIYRLAEDGG